jgi:mono/diheme cytochrome c family protein
MIAPGLREPPSAPGEREVAAIVAYVRRLSRQSYPGFAAQTEAAATVYARYCVGCHVIDGEGGTDGPDLSRIGAKHDLKYLERLIADPEAVNPDAEMPSFDSRLTDSELNAIAAFLASRK